MSCGCAEQRKKIVDAVKDGKPGEAIGHAADGAIMLSEHALRQLRRILRLHPERRARLSPRVLKRLDGG